MRHTATMKGAKAIFLFIAELNGFRDGTVTDKLAFGQECYVEGRTHKLDYKSEEDRKDLHENIWLERLYEELDNFFQLGPLAGMKRRWVSEGSKSLEWLMSDPSTTFEWSVPIELDASASMLQYIGVLLNDERLCEMTNVIGADLQDPWKFDGINRNQFKKAATPRLYGSSKACHELWQDNSIKYTVDQVRLFNNELTSGALGLADQFKEFIINNVKPTEEMMVKIFNEEFNIECNRFRNIGEITRYYEIFDTETNRVKRIHHTDTKREADLDQFRRYFVTLLIHNLDSQVADKVIAKTIEKYGWGMDLHDAFIVNPEAAEDVRTWYAAEINLIHENRKEILANYFQSIGIGAEAQGKWERVTAMVHPIETTFRCQPMALK